MVRRVTETMDPKDFLLFAQAGAGGFEVLSPLIDFEASLFTGVTGQSAIVILSDFPSESYGGIFFRNGVAGDPLSTRDLVLFENDASLLGKVRINAGNDKLELLTNNIVRAIGTHNIQVGVNYHIQWRYKVSNTVGVFEVKLDNDLDVLTYNGDTTGAGGSYNNRFEFPAGMRFDSLFINDTAGAEDNGYGGVIRMKSFVPTSDGFWEQWLTTSGVNSYAMLNQTPHDGDTTIIYSNVNGDKSSFVCPGHGLSSPSVIKAVSARWVVRKVSDGRVRPFFRIGGVDYPIAAASVPVGVGYGVVTDRRTVNHATVAAWALGDTIDSFGIQSVL